MHPGRQWRRRAARVFVGAGLIVAAAWLAGKWLLLADAVSPVHRDAVAMPGPPLLKTNAVPDPPPESLPDAPDRVAAARERCGVALARKFGVAGIGYPPAELFFRVFKHEGELEMWAGDGRGPLRFVGMYPVLRASGTLGPKRREGDRQVPEGFYLIARYNPRSLFHLSLGLDYPNASDRLLTTDREHPGSDIFIHGGCDSIGCLAMGDPAIEEIFLAAWDVRGGSSPVAVYIFPCRMTVANRERVLAPACAGDRPLGEFWRGLQGGYDAFEQVHRVQAARVDAMGAYLVKDD